MIVAPPPFSSTTPSPLKLHSSPIAHSHILPNGIPLPVVMAESIESALLKNEAFATEEASSQTTREERINLNVACTAQERALQRNPINFHHRPVSE